MAFIFTFKKRGTKKQFFPVAIYKSRVAKNLEISCDTELYS